MSGSAPTVSRQDAVEEVARTLLVRTSLLTRLLLRGVDGHLSRTEAGLLSTLACGPQRITELAECEALAQPTITQLVAALEQRGYVTRQRDPADGRVVLVSLSHAGHSALESSREEYRALLRDYITELPDADVCALVGATEALAHLIDTLQRAVTK